MNNKKQDTNILLERLVAQRTSEITKAQENLLIAEYNRKTAEHKCRIKSEFLARMNHEMLTPMNAIIGFAELAKTSGDLEQIKQWIDKINDSSKHLLVMLRNILDVSDGSSAFTITESQFSITTMIKYIINKTNCDLKKKKQTISLSVSKSIPKILIGDEKRIAQVIIHLLINAIKFSPKQSNICLNLNIHNEENETIMLKTEVIDNGIGVSKEQQERLFDLFEQVDGSKTKNYGGIGIGLPLSKCIANMMDGDIWVESEPGEGSKFIFTCKVKKVIEIEAASEN
ncbi:MAG: ATP-binding protein [Treponema sp.]|nr:ATP-binding protein [Treponema sp.]